MFWTPSTQTCCWGLLFPSRSHFIDLVVVVFSVVVVVVVVVAEGVSKL